jgi:hypothetical protein
MDINTMTKTKVSALIQTYFRNYKMGHVSQLSQKQTLKELYLKPTVKQDKFKKMSNVHYNNILYSLQL